MDDLGHRDELLLGIRPIGEVGDGALFGLLGHVGVPGSHGSEELAVVFDLIHRWDIDALDLRELSEQALGCRRSCRCASTRRRVGDVTDDFFAVAEHGQVDEVGDRFGVVGAMTTDCDEWIGIGTPSRVDRHAGKIDAVDEVRVVNSAERLKR